MIKQLKLYISGQTYGAPTGFRKTKFCKNELFKEEFRKTELCKIVIPCMTEYALIINVVVDVDVFGHRCSGIVLFNHACVRERGRALQIVTRACC